MPRTLAIDPRVPTSHGLIIRRRTLAEQIRAHITIREARAYARRIVKQAQLHAEANLTACQSDWIAFVN